MTPDPAACAAGGPEAAALDLIGALGPASSPRPLLPLTTGSFRFSFPAFAKQNYPVSWTTALRKTQNRPNLETQNPIIEPVRVLLSTVIQKTW